MSLATAQDLVPKKSVSVRDRPRPGYDARGVPLGTFRLYPRLTIGRSYDDNIYATDTDVFDDHITALEGNLRLQSQSTRLPISVYAGGSSWSYSENPLEDYAEWQSGGSLGYELARRTAISMSGDYSVGRESRGDPSAPDEAIELPDFQTGNATLEITHDFASGQLNLTVGNETIDFDDALLEDGDLLDQDFRDRNTRTFEIQGNITVGQSTAAFFRAGREERDYGFDPDVDDINRDATSDTLLGGVALDISNLMRGEVGLGVVELDNHDPDQSDRRAVAASSNLEIYMTQLMTTTFEIQRTSAAADIEGFASYIGTRVSLAVDYEIRRNFILSARLASSRREYAGVEETDTSKLAGLNARWLLNRHMSVAFGYTLTERTWTFDADSTYTGKIFTASMNFVL